MASVDLTHDHHNDVFVHRGGHLPMSCAGQHSRLAYPRFFFFEKKKLGLIVSRTLARARGP